MSENPIYVLDGGVAKTLTVYEDRCTLAAQKNVMSFITQNLFNGEKEFYYSNLTSVQFKRASKMINGYVQFEYPGSHSGGNNFGSENSFTFRLAKVDNETMEKVVEFIKTRIREAKNPSTTMVNAASAADELKKFKELLDAGVISQEEFDEKKKQLLTM